jgi:hypothetical protein
MGVRVAPPTTQRLHGHSFAIDALKPRPELTAQVRRIAVQIMQGGWLRLTSPWHTPLVEFPARRRGGGIR